MKQSERAEIRCEFITGSFAIGPDGLKEPIGNKMFPGWPEYARKLEDEIHRLRTESKIMEENIKIAREALQELLDPKGAYSMDMLEHAKNVIKNVAETASAALLLINLQK